MPATGSEITDNHITAFRSFNRFYTREIGTLREGLLDSEFSLTQGRVLYELATRGEITAGEIARELYARCRLPEPHSPQDSKMAAWSSAKSLPAMRARQSLHFTRRGRENFADLNERSNRQAGAIFEACRHLPNCRILLNAMRSVEETLSPAPEHSPIYPAQPSSGRHGLGGISAGSSLRARIRMG